jgi:thiamine biosynthesis protein ThiS
MQILFENREINVEGKVVSDFLSTIGINPETVLVVRNKEVLLESDELRQGDRLELVKVISGG